MRPPAALAVLFACVTAAGASSAQPPAPWPSAPAWPSPWPFPPHEPSPPLRSVAFTFSLAHLIFPVYDLTAEVRLGKAAGLAAIGGIGAYKECPLWGAGAQIRWYAAGRFDHGFLLGLGVVHARLRADGAEGTTVCGVATGIEPPPDAPPLRVTGTGRAVMVGPFAGYKVTGGAGPVLELSMGASWTSLRGEGIAQPTGQEASASTDKLLPVPNLGVGWAF